MTFFFLASIQVFAAAPDQIADLIAKLENTARVRSRCRFEASREMPDSEYASEFQRRIRTALIPGAKQSPAKKGTEKLKNQKADVERVVFAGNGRQVFCEYYFASSARVSLLGADYLAKIRPGPPAVLGSLQFPFSGMPFASEMDWFDIAFPDCGLNHVSLRQILGHRTFKLLSTESRSGVLAIRFSADVTLLEGGPEAAVMREGSMEFWVRETTAGLKLAEAKLTSVIGAASSRVEVEFGPDDGLEAPPLKSLSTTTVLSGGKYGGEISSTVRTQYSNYASAADLPESRFTLKHYGLPEPHRAGASNGKAWYVLLIVFGAATLAFVAFRWRVGRVSAASD